MDAQTLAAIQGPLEERCREDSAAAGDGTELDSGDMLLEV